MTVEDVARVPRYPDDYLNLIASKLKDKTAWGDLRNARFAKLLQFSLGRYFKGGLNMCRAVVAGLTKVLYKVSTLHESIKRFLIPSVIFPWRDHRMFFRGTGHQNYATVDWSDEMCLHIRRVGIFQDMPSSSGEPSASTAGGVPPLRRDSFLSMARCRLNYAKDKTSALFSVSGVVSVQNARAPQRSLGENTLPGLVYDQIRMPDGMSYDSCRIEYPCSIFASALCLRGV